MFNKVLDARIRSATRAVPITHIAPDDIFIVGYPKSGNTWLQHLVAGIRYGLDPEWTPDALVQEVVPDVHVARYYKRYGDFTCFKSHHLPTPRYQRVIYLLRDGRDVMVSYYHHLRALHGDGVDFLEMVRSGEGLFPCKWREHVEAWLPNPYAANLITVKYEDLKHHPVSQLKRICAFMGLERDEAFLDRVAAKAGFATMRWKERRFGWDNPQWPRDKFFVRRGEVGSYRDEMPGDVLETFLQESADTLGKCGYAVEVDSQEVGGGQPQRSRWDITSVCCGRP